VVQKSRPNTRYRLPGRHRLAGIEWVGKSKWLSASLGALSTDAFHVVFSRIHVMASSLLSIFRWTSQTSTIHTGSRRHGGRSLA
jgi:hypothetical protein